MRSDIVSCETSDCIGARAGNPCESHRAGGRSPWATARRAVVQSSTPATPIRGKHAGRNAPAVYGRGEEFPAAERARRHVRYVTDGAVSKLETGEVVGNLDD